MASHQDSGSERAGRRPRRFSFTTKTKEGREDLGLFAAFGVLRGSRRRRDR